jgi:hypothetical protein
MGGWDGGVVFALSGVWSQATASVAGLHPAAPSLLDALDRIASHHYDFTVYRISVSI